MEIKNWVLGVGNRRKQSVTQCMGEFVKRLLSKESYDIILYELFLVFLVVGEFFNFYFLYIYIYSLYIVQCSQVKKPFWFTKQN